MPTIAERTVPSDSIGYEPTEPPAPTTSPSLDSSNTNLGPGLNTTLRSPLPQLVAAPDNLRQFYSGGNIPQIRSLPTPLITSTKNGTNGTVGATGATGPTGDTGPAGPTGPSGQPTVTRNANGTFVQTSDGLSGFIYEAWGIVSAPASGTARTTATITFPVAFPGNPVVVLTPLGDSDSGGNNSMSCYAVSLSSSGCTANLACATNIGGSGSGGFSNVVQVNWHASF